MKKTLLQLDTVRIRWELDTDYDMPNGERCEAVAVVSYECSRNGDRRLETLTSGGLNGIDGATGDYRREVETEQLNDLREHLRAFGVSVGNFAQLAGRPDLQD